MWKEFALILMKTINQIEPRTGFLKFYDKTKKLSRCFASFSLGPEQFTHGMYITVLICPTYLKIIETIMYYERMMPKCPGTVAPSPSR